MYKKIQADSDFVDVTSSMAASLDNIAKQASVLNKLVADLMRERLADCPRATLAVTRDKQQVVEASKGDYQQDHYYLLQDDSVIYIEKIENVNSSIDRVHVKRIGEA